jgi:hypothetical protein
VVSIPRQLRLQVRLIQEDWHTYAKCEKRDRPLPVYVNNQLQFLRDAAPDGGCGKPFNRARPPPNPGVNTVQVRLGFGKFFGKK